MATEFTLTSQMSENSYSDNVSLGDAVTYSFDLRPWQADNSPITSVSWTNESGQSASISEQSFVDGIASALISFNQAGRNLISLTITTAHQKKKLWLAVKARDKQWCANDYGMTDGCC